MNSKDVKNNEKNTSSEVMRNAVQQIRPDDKCETIMKPATIKEVKEAVREINPDDNSMNSRG